MIVNPTINSQIVTIFDTTLRDGELAFGVKMNAAQKIEIALALEAIGVDVIEVGYPGRFAKDLDEVQQVAGHLQDATICALAGTTESEILAAATALKTAKHKRIHLYTPVHFPQTSEAHQQQVLATIAEMVSFAKLYCEDIEWSAFDAPRSQPDFLCQAVATAIAHGATTISIPDTLGASTPNEFSHLLQLLRDRVPELAQVVVSVHCHDDRGLAVANSLAALDCGARQIECSVNGLGARKGNANLAAIATEIAQSQQYQTRIQTADLPTISALVSQITGISP